MDFIAVWFTGLINPFRSFDNLKGRPAPYWGFGAMTVRWVGTALTTGVLALLLDRQPSAPSYLTFLSAGQYRFARFAIGPAFGLGIWLLMSATAHIVIRLTGRHSSFDKLLNVIAWGMLIPMPIVWVWDWAMLVLDTFDLGTMAISHSLFQAWEAALQVVGLRRVLGLETGLAVAVAVAVNVIFVLLAMVFVR